MGKGQHNQVASSTILIFIFLFLFFVDAFIVVANDAVDIRVAGGTVVITGFIVLIEFGVNSTFRIVNLNRSEGVFVCCDIHSLHTVTSVTSVTDIA